MTRPWHPDHVLPDPIPIGTVAVHPIGTVHLLGWMKASVAQGQRARITYANAHTVMLAANDRDYRTVLRQSDLVFCDGYGVWGASRWLGTPLPERMTPPDWSDHLFALAHAGGWSLYFLGGTPGSAERAAARVRERYHGIEIATHHGYFDPKGRANNAVLTAITTAQPTLLLVGMGSPRQELWMADNHRWHATPLTMAVGSLFDYLAGTHPRGPRWMTQNGTEWLWRLTQEPARLWQRYLLGLPRFAWHILRSANRGSRGYPEEIG